MHFVIKTTTTKYMYFTEMNNNFFCLFILYTCFLVTFYEGTAQVHIIYIYGKEKKNRRKEKKLHNINL